MKRLTITAVLALAGCAGYQPIIDTHGADMSRYHADLSDCQAYAQQINPAGRAAGGAAVGALFGVAVSAIFGGDWMAESAALGALSGAASAGSAGAQSQVHIVRTCMQGRGYRVLN